MEEEKEITQEITKPYKVYETKEAWQETIDTIIGNRLKDYRETKETLARFTPILEEMQTLCEADTAEELPQKLQEKLKKPSGEEMDLSKLKETMSEENWDKIAENKCFQLAIKAGLSPSEAYTLALLDEKRQEESAARAVQKPVEESAMQSASGMMVRLTPSRMTFKELDEISARVARGEKISF